MGSVYESNEIKQLAMDLSLISVASLLKIHVQL